MANNDNELVIRINGDIKGYNDALKSAAKQTENLQKTLTATAKAGAVAFASFGAAIVFATKSAAKFETISTQFEVLTGSVEQAKKTIKDLSDFSAKTPFQFTQIAQAGKQLLGFKFEADKIPDILQKIGDVSAATGAAFTDMTLIFGQVKAAGKLTGERLLQLQERAVPIGPALAETMGVAETAIRDLVSRGEVDFATFEKAFASLSEEGGLAFQGMEKNSQTLEGQMSTMGDNFSLVTAAIGENFLPALKLATSATINLLEFIRENPGLTSFISKMLIAGTVTGAIVTAGSLAILMFIKLRAAIIASAIATRGLSFAVKGLIGATGIGLLIAFLPEILQMFEFVFEGSLEIVKRVGRSIINLAKGLGNILRGLFTFNADAISLGFDQFKDALTDATFKTIEENKRITESDREVNKTREKFRATEIKAVKKHEIEKAAIQVESFDKKTQALKDENELIKAALAGMEKEEISFLKRRQQLRQKERDAQAIQGKERKAEALENIKLLSEQIIADEKALASKRAELQAKETEKEEKAADKALQKQTEKATREAEILDKKSKREANAANKELERQNKAEQKASELAAKETERTAKRIQTLADEAEVLKAHQDEMESEEIGFLQRRQELKNQSFEADKIKNEEEKTLTLENIQLKNDLLIEQESEFFLKRSELRAEQQELENSLQEELAQLTLEQRETLDKEDLDFLRNSLQTKSEIRSEDAKKELLARRKEQETFRKDEEMHGTAIAKFKAFSRTEEFANAERAANALSQLQQSGNAEMKSIGKAAALVQIAIDTQRGAIAAYTSLAGIPYVGPFLGVAAAAAITAFGLERAQKVQAAQSGGVVRGTGFGDTVPFLLEPGELITPRQNFEEVITAVSNQRAGVVETPDDSGDIEQNPQMVEIGFNGDEAADVLTVKQNEQTFLGTSQQL